MQETFRYTNHLVLCVFLFFAGEHGDEIYVHVTRLLAVGRMGLRKLERRFKVTSVRRTPSISFVRGVYEFQNQLLLFVFRTFWQRQIACLRSGSFPCVLRHESSENPTKLFFISMFTNERHWSGIFERHRTYRSAISISFQSPQTRYDGYMIMLRSPIADFHRPNNGRAVVKPNELIVKRAAHCVLLFINNKYKCCRLTRTRERACRVKTYSGAHTSRAHDLETRRSAITAKSDHKRRHLSGHSRPGHLSPI